LPQKTKGHWKVRLWVCQLLDHWLQQTGLDLSFDGKAEIRVAGWLAGSYSICNVEKLPLLPF